MVARQDLTQVGVCSVGGDGAFRHIKIAAEVLRAVRARESGFPWVAVRQLDRPGRAVQVAVVSGSLAPAGAVQFHRTLTDSREKHR